MRDVDRVKTGPGNASLIAAASLRGQDVLGSRNRPWLNLRHQQGRGPRAGMTGATPLIRIAVGLVVDRRFARAGDHEFGLEGQSGVRHASPAARLSLAPGHKVRRVCCSWRASTLLGAASPGLWPPTRPPSPGGGPSRICLVTQSVSIRTRILSIAACRSLTPAAAEVVARLGGTVFHGAFLTHPWITSLMVNAFVARTSMRAPG